MKECIVNASSFLKKKQNPKDRLAESRAKDVLFMIIQ